MTVHQLQKKKQKSEAEILEQLFQKLTKKDKDFINMYFDKVKYEGSDNYYLLLKKDQYRGRADIELQANNLTRLDIARLNSNVGYVIDYIPKFFTGYTEVKVEEL